jgi:N utilization substance protein B
MKKSEARRQSRIWAVEALFSFLEHGDGTSWEDCLSHVLNCVETRMKSTITDQEIAIETLREDDFAKELVKTAVENLGKIKVVIRVFAPDFPIEKIAPINKSLLVLGISEMKFMGTPPVVVINEYIELAKLFAEEKSAGFINAVLDSFRKSLPVDETPHSEEN